MWRRARLPALARIRRPGRARRGPEEPPDGRGGRAARYGEACPDAAADPRRPALAAAGPRGARRRHGGRAQGDRARPRRPSERLLRADVRREGSLRSRPESGTSSPGCWSARIRSRQPSFPATWTTRAGSCSSAASSAKACSESARHSDEAAGSARDRRAAGEQRELAEFLDHLDLSRPDTGFEAHRPAVLAFPCHAGERKLRHAGQPFLGAHAPLGRLDVEGPARAAAVQVECELPGEVVVEDVSRRRRDRRARSRCRAEARRGCPRICRPRRACIATRTTRPAAR